MKFKQSFIRRFNSFQQWTLNNYLYLKRKTRESTVWQLILEIDLTFIALLLASYVSTIEYAFWERLLFSFGIWIVYKVFIADMIRLRVAR